MEKEFSRLFQLNWEKNNIMLAVEMVLLSRHVSILGSMNNDNGILSDVKIENSLIKYVIGKHIQITFIHMY